MLYKVLIIILSILLLNFFMKNSYNFIGLMDHFTNNYPKILYIVGVENSYKNIELIRKNYNSLRYFNEIQWCFLHFDGENDLWKEELWYNKISNKYKFIGKGCKVAQWGKIHPVIAQEYDYLWFSDGDIGLERFKWNIYRQMLIRYRPLLSQPAILPIYPGRRASDHRHLNWKKNMKIGKIHFVEVMSPFISTKIWPLIYEKIQLTDKRSIWDTEKFFNKLVDELHSIKYLNYLSPVIHHNFKNLQIDSSLECQRKFFYSPEPKNYYSKISYIAKKI